MGGKSGGGGGGLGDGTIGMTDGTKYGSDPNYVWDSKASSLDKWGSGNWVTQAEYDASHAPPAKEEETPEPEPEAPAAAVPDPMANMPAAPVTDTTLAPPTATAGDTLGGAVIAPPRYWVGGLDQYESTNRTGRGGSGAMKTTQT